MIGYFFSKEEIEYDKKFPIQKAIDRGTPVTKQEIIELIGKDLYEQEVAFYAQNYPPIYIDFNE